MIIVTMLLTEMLPAVAAMRDATLSTWGSGEVAFGLPQALVLIGILIFLSLLFGVVIWRIRQTSQTRSK